MTSTKTEWRPFTIPNVISLGRLACIPWFVWLLFANDDRLGAAILLAVLGATDWIDGWFARRFDQVSEFGKILDPTADRLMMLTAIISTWIDGSVPAWFAALTLLREALVSIAALGLGALGVKRFDVTWWGKTGTFFLMFAYPLLLAGASTSGAADVLRFLGWVFGIPGLAIAWYAAWGYVPIARQALSDLSSETD
jgi:cardiolipin synthase